MDANSLRKLQEKDAAGWQLLTSYLDANPEARIHGDDSDPWTSADLYAHLARWLDHSSDLLEAQRDGTPKPQEDGTIDEINARFRADDAELTSRRPDHAPWPPTTATSRPSLRSRPTAGTRNWTMTPCTTVGTTTTNT